MNNDITIDIIKSIFRGLEPTEIDVKSESKVYFTTHLTRIYINKNEIDHYINNKDRLIQQSETNLFIPGYYEQAVEFHGRAISRSRIFKDNQPIKLQHLQSNIEIELSQISTTFCIRISDCDEIPRELKRFNPTLIKMRNPESDEIHLSFLFSRIFSIKVTTPADHNYHSNIKQLRILSESSLFNISYTYSTSLIPIKKWQKSFYFLERDRIETAQFPLRSYTHELVAYYQMALGAESLILAYLALYKILEYFFTSASEKILHEKIKEQIVAPDFSHTKTNKLRELAKTIRRYDQKMDERKMLQTVIEEYLDREQLSSWIESFDAQNENYLTTERDVFNESNRIDKSNNYLYSSVSARIYLIRNALVHNKEGELSRFTPFSGQETTLSKETPLLKFIAETLIIKTAKDIAL